LKKIQLLQQQQLPFHPHGDTAQDADLLDTSGPYSESSGTSSPSPSPRASNHSLHSSSSASKAGSSPSLEQDDEGKASCHFIFCLNIT
jgi:serine/threonine-protein kinase/endoribonuclease IRE1